MATIETAVFTNSEGISVDLNDQTTTRLVDMVGVGRPDPTLFTQELPISDGGIFLGTRMTAREIGLQLVIKGTSYVNRLEQERRLVSVLSPRLGMGVLSLARLDGTIKQIDCVPVGGLDWAPEGRIGVIGRRTVLRFYCPNPFFRTPSLIDLTVNAATGSVPKVNTAFDFVYSGNAPSRPVITINGPATDPYVRCTGPDGITRTVGVQYGLPTGSTLVFDFSGTPRTIIVDPDTSNIDIRSLVVRVDGANPQYWDLQPGTNTITIGDQAATPTATALIQHHLRTESL